MKHIVACALLIVLTGCTASYQQNEMTQPSEPLSETAFVYIVIPHDGRFERQVYPNFGVMTADATRAAFSRHAARIEMVDTCSIGTCFAKLNGEVGYLVIPEILHWEDRATEWSGKADRLEVKITVYDLSTQEILASSVLQGRSQWATLGGDHPQDLLPEPINSYVDSLYP